MQPYNQWPDANGGQHQPGEDYSFLDSFGAEYKPESSFRPGLNTLADGVYDFEVLSASLDRTPKSGDNICRVALRVLGGGVVEWTHFLKNQRAINNLCATLSALGFDAEKWGPAYNRPLSVEIPRAVDRLKGIRFRAAKETRRESKPGAADTLYHDLHVSGRVDGRTMPPLPPPVPHANGSGRPAPAPSPGSADDIPF